MPNDILSLTTLKGTVRQGGEAYGEMLATAILGYCLQEVKPDHERLAYAARSWRHIEQDAPLSAEFMRGIAAGAHLPLEYVTLLTLAEEIGHRPHCTAFVATGEATQGGRTIGGQTWDTGPHQYPWPGLLRLELQGTPHTITYHFPGIWACAGLNDAGLSLVWTTSGVFPLVTPEVGVPTYVLVAEVLRRRTVVEAICYLQGVKLAGAFIFLLGDATGAVAVVEALPGYVGVDQSGPALWRANHYLGAEAIRLSRQDITGECAFTGPRCRRMADLVREHYGALSPAVARAILTDRLGAGPWLHQYPQMERENPGRHMSLDSLIAVSQDRVLHTCRGGRQPGPWQEVVL
jgi:hypothetical protein